MVTAATSSGVGLRAETLVGGASELAPPSLSHPMVNHRA